MLRKLLPRQHHRFQASFVQNNNASIVLLSLAEIDIVRAFTIGIHIQNKLIA